MDTLQIEAAIFAIGTVLNWTDYPRGSIGITPCGRQYDTGLEIKQYYAVLIAQGEEGRISPDIESDGGYYTTNQMAKIACEKHYHSGVWDST